MPIPLIAGAASAFLPSVVDAITGASAGRRRALDRRNRAMDSLLADTQRDIGANAVESTGFKTGMGMLNNQFKAQNRTMNNRMVSSGATPEAQAGMREAMSNSMNTASLGLLSEAQRRREMLKRQYAALLEQRTNADVTDANETLSAQGQAMNGISQMVPYLFDFNKTNDKAA